MRSVLLSAIVPGQIMIGANQMSHMSDGSVHRAPQGKDNARF
ncbi:MAG TPA: hypothetical protein VGT04_01005 [Acidobacteriaceae bacterium]|nr:hypothetical protein [Acidobacteriaceae bacterium]